jgi:hypothetical protein
MRSLWMAALAFALSTTPAFAAFQYSYQCYPTDTSSGEKETLKVTPRTITLSGHKLALDTKYKPRFNKDYNRYDGDTSFLTAESYAIEVLVHKSALTGTNKTWMKIFARGEGFFNTQYYCYLRK